MTRFARVPIDAARDDRLNKTDWRVLIAVSSHANAKTDQCWPTLETLRGIIGCRSKTTIHKAVNRLVEYGWLKKKSRKGKSGRFDNNVYEIVFKNPLFEAKNTVSPSKGEQGGGTVSPPKGEQAYTPPRGEMGRSPSGGEPNKPSKQKNITDGLARRAFDKGPRPIQVWPGLTSELQKLGLSAMDAGDCLQDIGATAYEAFETRIACGELPICEAAVEVLSQWRDRNCQTEIGIR